MFTWGLLAAATMFVRTPLEFNVLRFLLGMAEAGFYPGVIYYLTLWFPARMRARAVSRFYVSLPLSSVVMGSVAGWLLGLGGKLGLSGWQWLFLVEGLADRGIQPGDSEDAAGQSGQGRVADRGRKGVAARPAEGRWRKGAPGA